MDARSETGSKSTTTNNNRATVERKSERELVVSRTINGPARIVFEAWTKPELFQQWWVPKSAPIKLVSCEMDVREGGTYRLVFTHPASPQPIAFFGNYLEVKPHTRLAWTNDEGGPDARSISTVTFEERGGKTLVTLHELHPSKEALEEALGGSATGTVESLEQLEAFIATQQAS